MPLPGPSSIKLNFLGFPKLSQKETVQIANISPNKNEQFFHIKTLSDVKKC